MRGPLFVCSAGASAAGRTGRGFATQRPFYADRSLPNRASDRSERADRNTENGKDEVADGRKRAAQQTTETEAGDYPACGHKKPTT